MAIGKVRAAIIIVLFATSATIPVLMETAIVPMMNLLNFIENFAEVEYDQYGNPVELKIKYEALINSIQSITCLTEESDENKTIIQLKMNVSNTDPFRFDLLIPGIDMTIYWKAGLPYEREKETVLGWKYANVSDADPHKEPKYDARRWTRVIGLQIDPLRVGYGARDKFLYINLILYNDIQTPGMSSALGQMIGTIFRTQSTKDPYTNETLMHISGSASLDIPGMSFPLGLDLGFDLSGFLNFTSLLGGLGEEEVAGGAGAGESEPSLFELIFQPGGELNIFDVQNYNDSNQNFVRDYSGIDNQTGIKMWTEELYKNGAISAYIYMDLIDKLGFQGLNLTVLKSSHNPDDADVNRTWNPQAGGFDIGPEETTNQIFLYLPDSPSLSNSDWANKIFGLFGFTHDEQLYDYLGRDKDLGDGRIITGGTLRLTGDLRSNSNFAVGDGLGALITQAIQGVIPIGIFGSIDLQLGQMPLSLCLDIPLEVNLSSFLGAMGGDEGEGEEGGDMFSMLMDYLGFDLLTLNGLAFDTFNQILQLNMTTDLDMFLPYGIYMPDSVTYDTNGEAIPYLGIAGGPIQIFDAPIPEELNGQRFIMEYTESPTVINETHLQLSHGNVTEIERVYNVNASQITYDWWDANHPVKYFNTSLLTTTVFVDTTLLNDNFTLAEYTDIRVDYKGAIWKQPWYDEHLIMNITSLDSPTLKESMAKLMATLGSVRQGDGMAYLFNSSGAPSNLKQFLDATGELPNPDDHKSHISFTEDEFKIDVAEIVPDFGNGILTMAEDIGIDRLFIEYLNNSIPHNNTKTLLEDLLSIRQMLNILHQPGEKNDFYDYLVDANITYIENATIVDGNNLLVEHDTLKYLISISDGSYSWNIGSAVLQGNGAIFLNNTITGQPFNASSFVEVEYIASKLDLLDLSNMFGAILNLLFGSSDADGGGGGGATSDIFADIFAYLPGTLDALGIDFDRIMPDMINYLKWNISQPEPEGYDIKFFEMLDIAYHALLDTDTGGGESTDDLLSGSSRDLIDYMIKELTAKFIEQADPFQLMHAAINDLTPLMDYLNRSHIFSREVLIPLIVGLFPSGTELSVIGGESLGLEAIMDIIMPLITEMIMGGPLAHFEHEALNPFAWLTAPEAIEYQMDADYQNLLDQQKSVYQVGMYNWTADYPKYDNLRLMSNITLGLLMSGFGASDLWAIINQLGLIDLSGGDDGGTGDPFAGLKGLLSLIGSFVPATEWDSLLRELGIWSTWEGDFQQFDIWITPYIFGIPLTFYFDGQQFVDELINLENLLATGQLMGGEFVQLCLYENQSYGNPYAYLPGYDSSYNTGPYRDFIGINPYGTTDNWGWVPVGWDPGGYTYGSAANEYLPDGAADYKKSFLSRLISTVPVELDVDVLGMDPIDFLFSFSFPVLWFNIPIDVQIIMDFDPELFMRVRLEGNPSQLMTLFEEQGIPLFGLGAHFVGGDLAGLVTDMVDSLTNPSGGEGGSNETFEFPDLDMVSLLQSFLNADVDILHYWKYIVDPEFMKASEWYLDPGFVDINATHPTLIWDNDPNIPGDSDGIPDEYPWYRFTIPIYNQINPDLGPATTQGRNPALLDYLTPIGPAGSGLWREDPDGLPDGIQHYWFDTPYAYVNTSIKITDPWLWVPPLAWNNAPGAGYYTYYPYGNATPFYWGDDPWEQCPLLQTNPSLWPNGPGISDTAWDATDIPSLYYVPSGTSPGVVGSAAYYPLPQPTGTGADRYPNIWNAFEITLNQTDYRFGYWNTAYDEDLGKTYSYLETQPFYDLLSYAFYPQLLELLDWIAPLIVDLVESLIMPSSGGGGGGGYDGSFGIDWYHQQEYDSVYSNFDIDQTQPLDIFGMLQWIWEGAGTRWNGTHSVPNIEPFTIPDLSGALDWLADHGFTIEFLIRNLDKIFDMLSAEEAGGGPSAGAVDLGGDLAGIFSVEALSNTINAIEDYFRIVVAQNPDGSPNRTKATLLALSMLKDMTEILDIYPIKAMRGALNYLMPRLFETGGSGTGGGSSSLDVNELDLGTFLEESGIMDLIFVNQSKLESMSFYFAIHKSTIDLYLFGQLIEDVPLDIGFELDLASLFGGGEEINETTDGESGTGGTDMLNDLPISFGAAGFPYIELSTFNGPFNISFELFNTSISGGKSPVTNTSVTIGEVWYNETTGVYIFNRTQSSDEFDSGIWGWTNPDANGIYRTYIRPNSLIRSDVVTGTVNYSSVIEEDAFGWVDPYIYIHVEEPNELQEAFYWWNVTGYPLQRTLAGNRPPYQARWIEDGRDIIVQSGNELPLNCTNIDSDPYWEIFARVEIDGYNMPEHDIVYVETGTVADVTAAAAGGGTTVQINASQTTATQTWNVFMVTDATKYVVEEELTPTGKTVTYPTISQVISGFHLRANNWNDDSIYNLRVDYVNLTGGLENLYNFQLPSITGANSGTSTYNGADPYVDGAFTWDRDAANKFLTLTFSPLAGAPVNNRYGIINIDASNFINATLQSVSIDVTVEKTPSPPSGTETTNRLSEDFLFTRPSTSRTYYFTEDFASTEVVIQGNINLNTKNATQAWFNYTLPITGNSFLNGIDWDLRANEWLGGSSTSQIAQVLIQYYNASDSTWYTLFTDTPGTRFYTPADAGYISPPYLDDWADLVGTMRSPHTGGLMGPLHDLYLTSRGFSHSASTAFETVTQIKFAARFTETPATINDGIGWTNNTRNFNTSAWVSFRFYPFVDNWGLNTIEIPEGFVNDFDVTIVLYDPLINLASLNTNDFPSVTCTYQQLGPLNTSITIDDTSTFAAKYIVYLEAWDSLVRGHGDHGDILFKDNITVPDRLEPLTITPDISTWIEVIDLEARMYINVTVDAGETLRNYYLKMDIAPALGFESRGYTFNYRFSIGSTNPDALRTIGAYPAKKVLATSSYGYPSSYQVGITDLQAFPSQYTLWYILTFEVSPQFMLNTTAQERFYFSAAWETALGSYETRSDKNILAFSTPIEVVYI